MENLKKAIRGKSREEVAELEKWIREYLTFLGKSSFKVGDKVYFETEKYGKITGVIDKINPKTIHIKDTKFGKTWRGWKVYPNNLYKIGG